MQTARRHLRFGLWLALVAMSVLALLPTLSHARAPAGVDSGWAEVCTPQGARLVALGGEPVPAAAHTLEHCPLCALGGAAVLPPAPVAAAVAAPVGGQTVPRLVLPAPRTLFVWALAQPRAPPSLS